MRCMDKAAAVDVKVNDCEINGGIYLRRMRVTKKYAKEIRR
jgi:hypothetical protein